MAYTRYSIYAVARKNADRNSADQMVNCNHVEKS